MAGNKKKIIKEYYPPEPDAVESYAPLRAPRRAGSTAAKKEADRLVKMPLVSHLKDLRSGLIKSVLAWLLGFALSLYFAPVIYEVMIKPLASLPEIAGKTLIYTGIAEPFWVQMKMSAYAALLLSTPVILYQLWLFIAPALYRHEKKYAVIFLVIAPLLFILGSLFCYFFIMPKTFEFLLSFEQVSAALPAIMQPRVAEYLSFFLSFSIGFGLAFEYPLILSMLVFLRIINVDTLKRGRKINILLSLIIGAILTPPDVISQIALALPLIFLYEMTIIVLQIFLRKPKAL